eukprot:8658742-Ditylum_brightwellii.AAC.1
MGFKVNPYDRCVANAMINRKQCTLAWYVDDNKLSHADLKVVDDILEKITEHLGELTTTRVDEHTLLGMKLKIKDKKIEVDVKEQLKEATEAFGEELGGDEVVSPARKGLMVVNEEEEDLDSKR